MFVADLNNRHRSSLHRNTRNIKNAPSPPSFPIRRCHPYTRKSASQAVLTVGCISPFLRLAEHFKAFRAWCQRCLAWSVKTRPAPFRHCRDARVYGRTTTAVHDNEYTPSPSHFPQPPSLAAVQHPCPLRTTTGSTCVRGLGLHINKMPATGLDCQHRSSPHRSARRRQERLWLGRSSGHSTAFRGLRQCMHTSTYKLPFGMYVT